MSSTPRSFETSLATDALYFHAAREGYARALTGLDRVKLAEARWSSLEDTERVILQRHGGDSYAASDELEPVAIQMESADYELGIAHAPILKEVAIVNILCVACLEAHINDLAKETFQGREARSFERLALEAKWLFLPKLIGCRGFEPGQQPFQGFAKMLSCRNELIHHKGVREDWQQGSVPAFVAKLGLTIGDAQESLKAVEGMIRELAAQRGVEPPFWLRADLTDISSFEAKLIAKK